MPLPQTIGTGRALLGAPVGLVTNGLVSEYRFNEGSGTTLTDYISGYSGTLGTGAGDQPDWVAAGLSFVNANADVVVNTTMPDSVLLGAITVSVVVNLTATAIFRDLLSKCAGNGSTQSPLDFLTSNAASNPTLRSVRANTASLQYSGPATVTGAYRMYSVVYADGNVNTVPTFYVGTTPTSGSAPTGTGAGAATGSSANLRIGRRADGAAQTDGTMAYILVYNRALSVAEITQNYTILQSRLAARGITLP